MSKNYSFEGQHDDEEILHVFRHHPVVMRKGLVVFLVLMIVGFIPVTIQPTNLSLLWLILASLSLGSLYMFYQWIGWYYSIYIITNQRFVQVTQKGLFDRSIADLSLDKIQTVNSQIAGIEQTMLGFGTIVVQTFAGDMVLEKIYRPQGVQTRLTKAIKRYGHQETEENKDQQEYASQEEPEGHQSHKDED